MTITAAELVHRLDGPDCSHWQSDAGHLDLSVTRAVPTHFLGWKATQSTGYIDPSFNTFRGIASALKFNWVLPYHWLSSTTDPVAQADHYLAVVGTFRPCEGAMLDAEEAGITVEKCLAWLERVEAVTHRPSSVYTGIYVAGGSIWKDARIRSSKYGPRMMHLAAYVSSDNLVARLTKLGLIELPIDAWQWSSNGPVPGITGRCDMNAVFNLKGYDSIVAPAPPPAPWPPFDPVQGKWGLYPVAVKPIIKEGAQGTNKDLVRYLQGVILVKAGGAIVVDGIFGPQTTKRVKDFQKFFGLHIDGIVGPKTWAAIDYVSQR